ncbi:MAG: menaquinone biosynthesis decarboxylase [Gaiella sp.]
MPSPVSDLREWIALLEREGELVRVSAEVDPDLEATEIVDRLVKSGGPAVLFENPKGARHPLLVNQFGTERRMCMAFGVDSLDDLGARLDEILELQPPQGLVDKVRSLGKLKSIADSMPKTVSKGACQEVVLTGDEIDLDRFPIQRCWPLDPAPFITLPAVITKDQATGVRNVGMYRMQKIDRASTFMHWQIHKDGRADLRAAPDGRIPVAVAVGLDPVTAYSASAPLPKHVGELMLAGFLKGSPVELVQCKTVDLQVPANAEIVLEGWVARDDVGIEGPFGDHTGFYTPPEEFPIFRLSAITMRRDAIYPSIVVGKPPAEDEWLAKATERIFLPAIRMSVPEIVDYDLPTAGTFHNCVLVSIRKRYPGHAKKVMHALWGLGLMSLTKSIVVVDEHVDVHDYEQVFFYACANVDPKRDVILSEGPIDQLDHATTLQAYGGKIGFDATAKGPDEGAREWPPEIEMSPEIRARVDARWSELGLPATSSDGSVQNATRRAGRRTLSKLVRR